MHQQVQSANLKRFETRCEFLGYLAWVYDTEAQLLCPPPASGLLQDWLRAPVIHDHLNLWIASFREEKKCEVVELFKGCWVLGLSKGKSSQSNMMLLMGLNHTILEAPEFREICSWAEIDPIRAAEELEPYLKHTKQSIMNQRQLLQWILNDEVQYERDQVMIEGFSEGLVRSYEETHVLFRLARMLNYAQDPPTLMQMFCNQLQSVLPFEWISIKFCGNSNVHPELQNLGVLSGKLPCEQEPFDRIVTRHIQSISADDWTRLLSPGSSELASMVGAEIATEPIVHNGQTVGALLAGNKTGQDSEMSSLEMQFLDASADFLGVFHENIARFAEQRAMFFGTIKAMTASIDAKDRYTCGHSERVALLGAQLAKAMGLDADEVEKVHIAGLLHDVGKIGVPESVLTKAGRLTEEEFNYIKQHPIIGYRILRDIPMLEEALPGVLYHHERYDGRGYPEGLSGEYIPLLGRILAVADTFDAMSSTRSYRAAMPREKVLTEIKRCAGTQFDPQLAKLFVNMDFSAFDEMVLKHLDRSDFAA